MSKLYVGARPRIRIEIEPSPSNPSGVVTDLKVIVKPPTGVAVTYDAPDASLTELDDNDWVWESPAPLTVVGKYEAFVRTTAGVEGSGVIEWIIHGISPVTYA